MIKSDQLVMTDTERRLAVHPHNGLLRFIACGSVDDGKSTLIGRLLHESRTPLEEQPGILASNAGRCEFRDGDVDDQRLPDGLSAYREPSITGNVAYRHFSTDRRDFVAADSPCDEQYTRNMMAEGSIAHLAVVLIDARKGVLVQTCRDSYIVSLIGMRHIVVVVNKMDLVGYAQEAFDRVKGEYREFARQIGLPEVTCIPISALHGDNVATAGDNMPWYRGATLMDVLETAQVDEQRLQALPFRMRVQRVNRSDMDFRGFTGIAASGIVRRGQRVRIQPSGRESTVVRIVGAAGDLEYAVANQPITLTLAHEVDVSCGDMISAADAPAQVADQFEASVIWMSGQPLLRGRNYRMKLGAKAVTATVAPVKYKVNVNTLEKLASNKLDLNEIGVVDLELDRPIAFDPYGEIPATGGFVLIDRMTNETVGAGMLRFALRRADNVHWQAVEVGKAARRVQAGHGSAVVWMTGLSGAGKSTIANMLEKRLHARGVRTYLLDGDNVRHGLNKDLGFTAADRVENIRRIAEVAKLMVDAGVIVITAFISPFRAERRMARELVETGEFIEVFVDTPLEVAEARDPKGLYKKARRGELKNFTGIDSPYEPPESPEVRIDATIDSIERAVERVLEVMTRAGLVYPD